MTKLSDDKNNANSQDMLEKTLGILEETKEHANALAKMFVELGLVKEDFLDTINHND